MAIRTEGLDDAAIEALRGVGFRGALVRPGDVAYDEARSVYNAMIDRRPALVAACTGTADVVAAVRFAGERGLQASVRGGGHGVAGFAVCDGGVMIDLSPMKGIRVDPERRTARAQPGLVWGEFDRETQLFGLATTGGVVSTTGIAGLTLGGGIGLLAPKHGLTCDNLIAADVVTAAGEIVATSERDNEELLWGLRGGGGNFGIVTSFEYRLHPVGPVTMALIVHPIEALADLLRFFRDYTADAPDEVMALVTSMTVPAAPPMPIFPEELLGKQVAALMAGYVGEPDKGDAVLKALTAFGTPSMQLVMPVPYTFAQTLQDSTAPWGRRNYWKSHYLNELTDEAIDVFAAHAPGVPSRHTDMSVARLGGAMARIGRDDTAFNLRDAGFICQIDSIWEDARDDEVNIEWTRRMHAALAPYALDRVYLNFIGDEGHDRVRASYGADTYARLAALKRAYDPGNFFRLNHNIAPA